MSEESADPRPIQSSVQQCVPRLQLSFSLVNGHPAHSTEYIDGAQYVQTDGKGHHAGVADSKYAYTVKYI